MDLFEQNIELLKRNSLPLAEKILTLEETKECEVINARNGMPTLKVNGYLYHSVYDPLRESRSIVDNFLKNKNVENYSSLIVIGMGFGYHINEFLKKGFQKIIVIEKNCGILKSVFSFSDQSNILKKTNLFSLDEEETNKFIEEINLLAGNNPLIYIHPPIEKILSKENVEKLISKLTPFNSDEFRGLKVMVTYPLYGGSYPVAEYTSRAFEKIGCRVQRFDMSKFYPLYKELDYAASNKTNNEKLKGLFLTLIEEIFVSNVVENQPNLIFSLAQSPISISAINRIKPLKIPLCYWFVEDFRLMDYWRNVSLSYDYFFTIQKGDFFRVLSSAGVKNYHYLPTGCDPEIHKPVELSEEEIREFKSDISFMGAGYYNRRIFFKKLADYDFKIWGTDWPLEDPFYAKTVQRKGERISIEDTVKIYNAALININLHSSTYHDGVNPYGDFLNPRIFEIAACGGFQLVDKRSLLKEQFEIGEEIECFTDIDELKEKIDYYLSHPEERKAISLKSRNRAISEHTYLKRMEEVLKVVSNGKGIKLEKPDTDINSYKNLVKQCGDDEECLKILSKFKNYAHISIKDIAREIEKGEGKLSQSEKIFLMMNEFAQR
ncbi:MAG: hypothetical protein D6734_12425 [Candidatus Schekmanbacteria bacterium]|nr:MAG: hypothetical protein D6734_12425 [Candidatus Schekmanbacteria bacterium]